MGRFLKNIRGSKFWKRVYAGTMVLLVLATLLPSGLQFAWPADNMNLLDSSTSITTTQIVLGAKYKDENGEECAVELNQTDVFEIPYDADISMYLGFSLQDGNAVDGNSVYTYKLPDTVRVDVDAWHDLSSPIGGKIGRVHIKKDGTLDFQFDSNVVAGHTDIGFYVQFEGNFSSDKQKEGEKFDINFPASDGNYSYHIETLPSSDSTETEEPKDIGISKSGSVVTIGGKRYIEWQVYLNPNGRPGIDGSIIDELPNGLTYVNDNGYPKIKEKDYNPGGNYGTVTGSASGSKVTLDLSGTGSQGITVLFLTSIDADGSLYGGTVGDWDYSVNNEVIFNPDDTTDNSVSGDTTVWIKPNMVSKSAGASQIRVDADGKFYIDWTVTLNAEQLDLNGATYTDTIGEGLIVPDAGDIRVSPDKGNLTTTSNGFQIAFTETTTERITVTYRTYVAGDSLQHGSYKNTATLTGGKFDTFKKEVSVEGLHLLDKTSQSYDPVTKLFTWTITVNQDRQTLTNVTVTDIFNPNEMEFIHADVAGTESPAGTVTFNLGNISDQKVIHVTTRMKDDFTAPFGWYAFNNTATLNSDQYTNISDTASKSVDTTAGVPDFVSKKGTMNGDGTISWQVDVAHISDNVNDMDFKDILPADMDYVEGSFYLTNSWGGDKVYRTPTVSGRNLSYAITRSKDSGYMDDTNGFHIYYQTRLSNLAKADVESTFTNDAVLKLNFDNNISVEDDAESTVTGTPGGVLDKTFTYQGGREVTWTVKINAGRYALNATDPVIEDQLPDYMNYKSGALYLVKEDGSRQAVANDAYSIISVNRKLMVQMPDITNECYEFQFVTQFNPMFDTALKNETIQNTVSFHGSAKDYTSTSNTVQNVEFGSSSAGAVINQEIRIRKVDAGDTSQVLPGAVFELKLNGMVLGTAVSDESGYAVFKNVYTNSDCTFELVEVTAPSGYVKPEDPVEIPFDGTTVFKTEEGVQYVEITVENENANKETTGSVTVYKVDAADSTQKLAGAVFGIYSDAACADADLIGQMAATDTNGMSTYAGLDPGTYYLKEITSPEGYVAGTKVIRAVLSQDGNKVTTKYYNGASEVTNAEFENQKIVGTLTITKTDADTALPLSGATFGLYSDALCNDLITSTTTTGSGQAVFTNLVPGSTYYYREDIAPPGYVKDSTVHSVKVGNGNEHEDVFVSKSVKNKEAVGNIEITKRGDDGKLLKGVEFTLYNSTGTTQIKKATTDENGIARFEGLDFGSYTVKETKGLGDYIVSNDTSVTVNKLGDTKVTIVNQAKKVRIRVVKKDADDSAKALPGAIFELQTTNGMRIATAETNADGIADFGIIGYGDYQIVETKAPDGYNKNVTLIPVAPSDFDTAIGAVAGTTAEPLISKDVTNKKQNGSISLEKHDQGGAPLAGATFTLYDSLKQSVDEVTTGADGKIEFINLPYGTYYIQETKAPDEYIRVPGYYRVEVNSDTPVTGYYDAANNFKTDAFVNTKMDAPYISFKLMKEDDSGHPLSGATFGFYEIKANGTRTEIATAVTGTDGIAYFHRINIKDYDHDSTYEVKEISAPAGYVADGTFVATFAGKDALNDFVDGDDSGAILSLDEIHYMYHNDKDDSTVTNREIKGSILLTKQGVTGLESLAGAEFTLYDKAGNRVPITGNPATTGANGKLRFENVPYGSYVIRETKAPKGYTLNPTPISVDITSESEVVLPAVRDNRISLRISKQAVGGATEIPGAKLRLTNASGGALIDQWTSGTTAHSVDYSKLEVGSTYRLSETAAPNGYVYASDITFTIKENGELQILSGGGSINGKTVVMRDEALQLSVRKLNETNADLPNAILAFYDDAENEMERWTTDGGAHAIDCSKISVPASGYKEYTLREISAPTGYATAESMRIAVDRNGEFYHVTAPGTYTPLTDATITMTDNKKPSGMFYIRKIDTGTGLPLTGADFRIISAGSEDLYDAGGNPVGDLPMWTWTSTDTPHAIDAAQLAADDPNYVYELVETKAPEGYTVAEPIQFRVVTDPADGKLKIEYVSGDASAINNAKDTFTIKDTTLSLSIRKRNEFGRNLSGAVLRLSEYNTQTGQIGERIEQFTSSTSDRVIAPGKLETGQSYILQEIRTPEGYQKAEDIIFTIHPDATIESNGSRVAGNIVIMEDVSNGIVINKYNENMEYLPGSELELTSVDDLTFTTKHWTTTEESKVWDMLYFKPGCTYTLTECSAPAGYAYAAPMTIRISEDGRKISVNGVEQDNRVVNMVDQKIKLFISKQDITNQKELSGAKLEIKDETGTVIYSFISGEQPTQIPNELLEVGEPGHYKTYTLTEITAPYGYEMTEDIQFAIDSEGSIYTVTEDKAGKVVYTKLNNNTVTMFDEPGYTVSKQDVAGKEVPGATLTITAKNDPDFQPITWISEERPKYFEQDTFTPGTTYILTETNAPNGYAYAETMEFSIDKDGNVLVNGKLVENKQVVMVDDAITVYISKQDMTNGTELQGAELVIKNEAGEVIYSFVSTSEPTLIPAEVFTAPKPGSYSYYSLTEITAPEGYEVAETIAFAIDSKGQIFVKNAQGEYVLLTEDAIVMQDKPDSSHSRVSGALKTGDAMRLNFIILLGLISLFTGCILLERSIFKK